MSDRISSWSCDHPKLCNDRSYDVSKIINSKKFEKSEPNGMTATVVKMTILERSLILRRKDQRKKYISGIFSRKTRSASFYEESRDIV